MALNTTKGMHMTTQHTPEPWIYDFSQLAVFDNGRTPICLTKDEYNHARSCVTLCAELSDGDFAGFKLLGGIKKYIAELLDQRSKAEQQRDELLAALKKAIIYIPQNNNNATRYAAYHGAKNLIESIAKAGG